jgi:hypothetical protein
MIDFAIKYRSAIDKITADRNTDLRKFELNDAKWEIARQLRDTLKVCFFILISQISFSDGVC